MKSDNQYKPRIKGFCKDCIFSYKEDKTKNLKCNVVSLPIHNKTYCFWFEKKEKK